MHRLFIVIESFALRGRTILLPGVSRQDPRLDIVRPGDRLLLRTPDGAVSETTLLGIEYAVPSDPTRPIAVAIPEQRLSEDIPAGTEVWWAAAAWDLDDPTQYRRVGSIHVPDAFTYGDTTPGKTDRDKREFIRAQAANQLEQTDRRHGWYALRITVAKSRSYDVENVPKLVVDAFSERQIRSDNSAWAEVALYEDDTVEYVRQVQVRGSRSRNVNATVIEVFQVEATGETERRRNT